MHAPLMHMHSTCRHVRAQVLKLRDGVAGLLKQGGSEKARATPGPRQ